MKTKIVSAKTIAKRNTAFDKLPKWKKRVAIAKDVLLQLKMEKYVPQTGTYISAYNNLGPVYLPYESKQLQDRLINKAPECLVCGIGAAFLSLSKLGNKVSLCDDYHEALEPIFGSDQVQLIELAFEKWKNTDDLERIVKVNRFAEEYPEPEARFEAIFKNIVKNKGKFKI